MNQFFQPPKLNTRLDLHLLFPQTGAKQNNQNSEVDFVPFNQERDKLGRLISRQSSTRTKKISESLAINLQQKKNKVYISLTERSQASDRTVQKIFKIQSIRNLTSSKSNVKLKLALPQSNSITPSIGYYDTTEIVDKIKYNQSKVISIKTEKNNCLRKIHSQRNQNLRYSRIQHQKRNKYNDKDQIIQQKLILNPNLPQLKNFRLMQKLQMQISPNFERDHQRFNEKMRGTLVRANQIKRELELD